MMNCSIDIIANLLYEFKVMRCDLKCVFFVELRIVVNQIGDLGVVIESVNC